MGRKTKHIKTYYKREISERSLIEDLKSNISINSFAARGSSIVKIYKRKAKENLEFISLIQLDKFDYTKWRQSLFNGMTGREISAMAMKGKKGNQDHT